MIHEMKLPGVKVYIFTKPKKDGPNYAADYRRDMERSGKFLAEVDLGDGVAIFEAESHYDVDRLRYIASGMAAQL